MEIIKEFTIKEKRDTALTVRLPESVIKKIRLISKRYNYSQSEIVEKLISNAWEELIDEKEFKENT